MHTLDLPDGNRTSDAEIIKLAEQENRIVVTKDNDFVDSHLLRRQPEKLMLVSTANLSKSDLEQLIAPLIPQIVVEFLNNSFVEVGQTGLVVRG